MATTIEDSLYAKLAASAGVTAILGAGDGFRLYPQQAPQGGSGLPYGVYQEASQRQTRSLRRVVNLNQWTVRIDIYGSTLAQAKAAARAVKRCLLEEAKDSPATPGTDVEIMGVFLEDEEDMHMPPQDADEEGTRWVSMTLTVHHRDPV